MAKKLPQILYVYREEERDGEFYFIAHESPQECAEKDDTKFVGKYELKETMEVSLKVDVVVKKAG